MQEPVLIPTSQLARC